VTLLPLLGFSDISTVTLFSPALLFSLQASLPSYFFPFSSVPGIRWCGIFLVDCPPGLFSGLLHVQTRIALFALMEQVWLLDRTLLAVLQKWVANFVRS
jgi:hypothetical protein